MKVQALREIYRCSKENETRQKSGHFLELSANLTCRTTPSLLQMRFKMNIHKAAWEQPAHNHPSRQWQSQHSPGVCVWQGGWRGPGCTHRGTDGWIELLWHCHPLSAHPNLRRSPQPCRIGEWEQPTSKLLPQGCSNPASSPSHSFSSCYHPHSQIFKYMCWNDLTIMAMAKIWCCFGWMWFKLPSAGLYFSGPILETVFPLTVTLIHMKIKQAE